MKILYIANIRLPSEKAHGIQIMKTCEAFAQIGADVELVVPTRRNHITEDPFTYYGVARTFTLTTLRVPDWVRFGSIGFLFSLLIFSERVRWLKHFWSADVIYSRDALVLLQYVLLGRRFVFEAHTNPSRVARFVARRAHMVVVISEALRTVYAEAGVAPEKVIVAPDAVDTRLFDSAPSRAEAREVLKLPKDAKIVVYTGHLYARKGADTLAQAASLVPDTQFLFVGGTAKDIVSFRARWGSQANVFIVGHLPPTQVPQYLRAADVLVIPNSATDHDAKHFTSPMKLFEYMASGTPTVASDVPAIREVLDEQDVTFFAPDSPAALAGSIRNVLIQTELAKKKAHHSEQKAAGYTWQKRAERILKSIHLLSS